MVVMAYCKVLLEHLLGEAQENHKNLSQDRWPITGTEIWECPQKMSQALPVIREEQTHTVTTKT